MAPCCSRRPHVAAGRARRDRARCSGRYAKWSMPAAASCCPASWTPTPTRYSPATAPANSNSACEGATYAEIAARGGGIRSTVRLTRAASGDELLAAGRRYREWFLRGGTTTIEAKSGYGLSLEAEVKILRTIRQLERRGPPALRAHFPGRPRESRTNIAAAATDYVDLVIHEMLPRVARRKPGGVLRRLLRTQRVSRWRRRARSCAPRRRSASACASTPTSSAPTTARCSPPNSAPPPPTIWRHHAPPAWPRCARPACSPCCCPARSTPRLRRVTRLRAA